MTTISTDAISHKAAVLAANPQAVLILVSVTEGISAFHVVQTPSWPLRHLGCGATADEAWESAAKNLED